MVSPARVPTMGRVFMLKIRRSKVMEKREAIKNPEKVVFEGRVFEIINIEQPDGRVFEIARRAPGVRTIIDDPENGKLLLTKEFRSELNGYDYRLPGGKVFDTLGEYGDFLKLGEDIMPRAVEKSRAESLEEAGIEVGDVNFYKKSTLGATVEWDLYVFETSDWRAAESGQQLEAGEIVQADEFFTYEQVKEMILNGDMKEERIAMILLQWLSKKGVK
jgi:8-oxo-dGTP pyrophosphatase MutT (NUDIX family)